VTTSVFAKPRYGLKLGDCQFYHTMEIPGVGLVTAPDAKWDLRPHVSDFLRTDLSNKRVIEIGPASGFLTFEMERLGGTVTIVDAPEDHEWDIVPFPGLREVWGSGSRLGWRAITNGWWFAHEHFRSKARAAYVGGNGARPEALGKYDIGVLSNILLHNRDPLRILTNCADLADTVIIVEPFQQDLEDFNQPLVRFDPIPTPRAGEENWNVWWRFSTLYFKNFLTVMGFKHFNVHRFTVPWGVVPIPHFTMVASR
jgi:O-methyltransferase